MSRGRMMDRRSTAKATGRMLPWDTVLKGLADGRDDL